MLVLVLVWEKDKVAHPHFRVWRAVLMLGITSCVLPLTQLKAQVCQ